MSNFISRGLSVLTISCTIAACQNQESKAPTPTNTLPKVSKSRITSHKWLIHEAEYRSKSPFGGMFKRTKTRTFAGMSMTFHEDGTADAYIVLGPQTNVYHHPDNGLEIAGHGWRSQKDVPNVWNQYQFKFGPGDTMKILTKAPYSIIDDVISVEVDPNRDGYFKLANLGDRTTSLSVLILDSGLQLEDSKGGSNPTINLVKQN